MRYRDLLNLRDGLLIDAMINDVPENDREPLESKLRAALERADSYLYNEQLPIILNPSRAQAIRQYLDKEIFQDR